MRHLTAPIIQFFYLPVAPIAPDLKCWISLVGHSLGGIVVGMVASELGRREIKSVVLIASGGVAPDLMLMGNFFGIRFDP